MECSTPCMEGGVGFSLFGGRGQSIRGLGMVEVFRPVAGSVDGDCEDCRLVCDDRTVAPVFFRWKGALCLGEE
jgi:hypothetical protein